MKRNAHALSAATSSIVEALEDRKLFAGIQYPAGAGVVDVTNNPYVNVNNTDGLDDTAAINQILTAVGNNSGKTIYFPDGVYHISGTIQPALGSFTQVKRTKFQGQSRDGTIFRLASGTFTNAASPQPVIDFNRGATVAQAFANYLSDFTIDVLPNNAGAIGISFYSNNSGAMRNIKVTAAGTGATGVRLDFPENGPLLVKDLQVDGFAVGVKATDHINSQVLESIVLNNQTTYGIQNGSASGGRAALSIHNLTSTSGVTPYHARYEDPDPNSYIINATLTGTTGASTATAVNTGGPAFVRGLTTTGYSKAYDLKWDSPVQSGGNGTNIEKSAYGSGQTSGYKTLNATPATSLNLPMNLSPSVAWGSTTDWAAAINVTGDDTASIQDAIDNSGKKTIYLPFGGWQVSGTLRLRAGVERLILMGGSISGGGTIQIDSGTASTVELRYIYESDDSGLRLVQNSSRTLVVKDSYIDLYSNTTAGTGDVYFENFVGEQMSIKNQKVWAKQLNLEMRTNDELGIGSYIKNDGGTLAILGLKTENRLAAPLTFIETLNGGSTEVIGGLNYYNAGTYASNTPAYKVVNANFGLALPKQYNPSGTRAPSILVQELADGVSQTWAGGKNSYFVARYTPPGPLFYEGFNNSGGSALNNASGGTGFTGNWSSNRTAGSGSDSTDHVGAVTNSLTYTNLNTTGNKARTNNGYLRRSVNSAQFGTNGTTRWISFLAYKSNAYQAMDFSLRRAGADVATVNFDVSDKIGLTVGGSTTSTTVNGAGANRLILMRLDYGSAGIDTAHLWVDPNLSVGEPSTASAVTLTAADLSFDEVDFYAGKYATHQWDELRAGATFATVAPAPASAASQLMNEGFDYTSGTALNGAAGGGGFGTNWSSNRTAGSGTDSQDFVGSVSGSLSYAGLTTTGGKARTNNGYLRRSVADPTQFGTSGTTRWISFLASKSNAYQAMDFSLLRAGSDVLTVNFDVADKIGLTAGGSTTSTGVNGWGATRLILMRIDYGAADNDTAYLWVDPNLSLGEPTIGSAFAASATDLSFDQVDFYAAKYATHQWDELRIGTAFSTVIA
jgi:hypothetical protein